MMSMTSTGDSAGLFSAPRGRDSKAQGNALGESIASAFAALKGRNLRGWYASYAPLGLDHRLCEVTQGVALGFRVSPRWGQVRKFGESNCIYGSSKLHGYGARSTFGSTFGL